MTIPISLKPDLFSFGRHETILYVKILSLYMLESDQKMKSIMLGLSHELVLPIDVMQRSKTIILYTLNGAGKTKNKIFVMLGHLRNPKTGS